MIRGFGALGQLAVYQAKNTLVGALKERPLSLFTVILLGAGFLYGYAHLSWLLLSFVYKQEVYGVLFATRMVEFLLFVAMGMSLMSSLTTAIAHFYLSKDLEFQFSLPIKFEAWVLFRLGQVYLQSCWMLLLFGGTFIWFYLELGGVALPIQVLGVFAFAVLCSFPIIFSACACMVLVKVFPARRVHQVFLVLTVVLVSSLIFLFRYLEPERFVGPGGLEQFRGFVDLVSPRKQPLNPAVWCANLIAALNQEKWSECWGPAGRLLLLFTLSLAAFLTLAKRLYLTSWDRALQSLSGEGEGLAATKPPSWLSIRLSHPRFSQEIREILLFIRDPSQWSQVFVLVALLGLYLFSVTRVPSNLLGAGSYLMALLNTLFVAFIALSVSSRFIFTAFSADGQAIWLMKTAPDGWLKYTRSKLVVFGIPCLVFAMTLSVGSAYLLGLRGTGLARVAAHAAWDSCFVIGLSLALGMLFINPAVENPVMLIVSPGGLFLMASGLFASVVHLMVRLTSNLAVLNKALSPYGWPDMQHGLGVRYMIGLVLFECVLLGYLIRRGLNHLRNGDYVG